MYQLCFYEGKIWPEFKQQLSKLEIDPPLFNTNAMRCKTIGRGKAKVIRIWI